jgi:hypothetical protein
MRTFGASQLNGSDRARRNKPNPMNMNKIITGASLVIGLFAAVALAAPPTVEEEGRIVGKWQVSSKPGHVRLYTISTGRNVKIVGSGLPDRSGKLAPQQDGSYFLKLDADAIQRIVFDSGKDQLVVQHYTLKKDLDRGLAPT